MVDEIIKDVGKALGAGAYRSALALALTLPDICWRIEGVDGDRDYPSYARWFDEYVAEFWPDYGSLSSSDLPRPVPPDCERPVFDGMACYKLRCAFLHAGNVDINGVSIDRFNLVVPSEPRGQCVSSFRTSSEGDGPTVRSVEIDAQQLCRSLCLAAQKCYERSCNKSDYGRAIASFSVVPVGPLVP